MSGTIIKVSEHHAVIVFANSISLLPTLIDVGGKLPHSRVFVWDFRHNISNNLEYRDCKKNGQKPIFLVLFSKALSQRIRKVNYLMSR